MTIYSISVCRLLLYVPQRFLVLYWVNDFLLCVLRVSRHVAEMNSVVMLFETPLVLAYVLMQFFWTNDILERGLGGGSCLAALIRCFWIIFLVNLIDFSYSLVGACWICWINWIS